MSIFDEIVPGNQTRLPPFPEAIAQYRVAIEAHRYLDGTGASGNKAAIFDFNVLESSIPEVEPGEFRGKYFSLNGNEFPGALKVQLTELYTFLVAACGFDPDSKDSVAAFRKEYPSAEDLYKTAGSLNGRVLTLNTSIKVKGPRAKTPGNVVLHAWTPTVATNGAAATPAPAAAPTPPPAAPAPTPTPCPAEWQRDASKTFALNPVTNKWHLAATGEIA